MTAAPSLSFTPQFTLTPQPIAWLAVTFDTGKWQAYLVRALTENIYAKQRGWTSFDSAVAVLRDYRVLCDNLVAKSRLPKRVIETSTGERPIYYEQVMKFPSAPIHPPPPCR